MSLKEKLLKNKIPTWMILIGVYIIIFIAFIQIVSNIGSNDNINFDQTDILSERFEVEQAVSLLNHRYEMIENPNPFDDTCCILSEEEYSKERYDSIIQAAKYLYENTGVQFYYFDVDITGLSNKQEIANIVQTVIDENVEHQEHALIYTTQYSSFYNEDEDTDYYLIKNTEFIVGDKAKVFFDTEGLHYFEELYDDYGCTWYNTLGSCVTEFCDTTLNYGKEEEQKTFAVTIATTMLIILTVATIIYGLRKKRTEDTIRILSTPIEELETEADKLVDKYK